MAELFGIKWDDFKTALSSSFEMLRKDNDFVDVTLISDGQKQFKGHKVVLSSCSPFFKAVFKANQHDHPLLYLAGVESKALELIFDYIYKGEIQLDCDYIEYFFRVAGKFKLSGFPVYMEKENKPKDVKEEIPTFDRMTLPQIPQHNQEYVTENDKMTIKMDGFEVEEVHLDAQQKEGNEEDSMMQNIVLQPDQKEYIRVDSRNASIKNEFKDVKKNGSGRSPFLGSSVLYQYCNVDNVYTKILDLMGKINGVHTCKYCGKETRDKTDLRKHAETHIDGLSFFCPKCRGSKKYPQSAMLRSHINKEHRDDAYFHHYFNIRYHS